MNAEIFSVIDHLLETHNENLGIILAAGVHKFLKFEKDNLLKSWVNECFVRLSLEHRDEDFG